jgi:uncharacterized integral membrane protein (TIGR00698 family)
VKFAAKRLLPVGVVLLGARLDFAKIVQVGVVGAAMSVATIVAGIGLFLVFIRAEWVERKLGLLLGLGTAICGGTAIVAAAPVLRADDEDVSFSVASVTLIGLITMFTLPLVGHALHMSDRSFGVWAGLSIHQTPQVLAAGYAYSQPAGDTATIVKLARVCLLAPALVAVAWIARRSEPGGQRVGWRGAVPVFVLGFLLLAGLRTMGALPAFSIGSMRIDPVRWCDIASRFLIVCAMAGVGLETRFSGLRKRGVMPLVLALVAAGAISGGVGWCLR